MLAKVIDDHPRRKMTLQEIYLKLKQDYGAHFPDDGIDDSKPSRGGWRVLPYLM